MQEVRIKDITLTEDTITVQLMDDWKRIVLSLSSEIIFLSEIFKRFNDCFRSFLGHFLKFDSQMLHLVGVIFREEFFIFRSDGCRAVLIRDP
jgi:hypothetical protein